MASDNLKHCRWCKHTMLVDALVCQQCHYGQSALNKPGLAKIIEIACIVLVLSGAAFAWQQATDAADSLAQSNLLSTEFSKRETNLVSLATSTSTLRSETDELSVFVADSLRLTYNNTMEELATDKNLLDTLCPSELTEVSLRLDCEIRHVEFSAKAVIALTSFSRLSPELAEFSGIDKSAAMTTVCGYYVDTSSDLFNMGDYVMGLENYVPYNNLPEVLSEDQPDLFSEKQRQKALRNDVIAFYKEHSRKWADTSQLAYENLKALCS